MEILYFIISSQSSLLGPTGGMAYISMGVGPTLWVGPRSCVGAEEILKLGFIKSFLVGLMFNIFEVTFYVLCFVFLVSNMHFVFAKTF